MMIVGDARESLRCSAALLEMPLCRNRICMMSRRV